MKPFLLLLLAVGVALAFSATAVAAKKKGPGKLRHVVSFKFKDGAKADDLRRVVDAFAALKTQAAVVERFGLQGYGGHTADNEYVLLDTIEARLYLAARVVMDVARGKGL